MNSFETILKILVASIITLGGGFFSLLMIATNQNPKFDAFTLSPYIFLAVIGFMWWGLFRKPSTQPKKLPQWASFLLLIVATAVFAWFLYYG